MFDCFSYATNVVSTAITLFSNPFYGDHTSALTAEAWVKELVHGHLDRVWERVKDSGFGVLLYVGGSITEKNLILNYVCRQGSACD